jgi:hypothetical protein
VEERELGPGSYRIGRADADLVLPHASVSARHAVLEVDALGVVIHDVGSRNGTSSPSGQRISGPYRLLPEQPVRLGKATLTLLRALGQAGGTRAMAQAPAPFAAPPVQLGALPRAASAGPPGIGTWLQLLGAALVLLLGFLSLKTCNALVETVSHEPGSKEPARRSAPGSPAAGSPAPAGKSPTSKRPANERAPRAR